MFKHNEYSGNIAYLQHFLFNVHFKINLSESIVQQSPVKRVEFSCSLPINSAIINQILLFKKMMNAQVGTRERDSVV